VRIPEEKMQYLQLLCVFWTYVIEWVCVGVGWWQGAFPRAISKRDLTSFRVT